MELTRLDLAVIQRLLAAGGKAGTAPPYDQAAFLAVQDESWRSLSRSREREECAVKLRRLGLLADEPG
jgi:thymidylate synthase (FAD)